MIHLLAAFNPLSFIMAAVVAAEGGSTLLGFSDLTSVFTEITKQFSVTTILGVIAGLVGICIVFAFMWWGVRKGISKVMAAVKKGRVSA